MSHTCEFTCRYALIYNSRLHLPVNLLSHKRTHIMATVDSGTGTMGDVCGQSLEARQKAGIDMGTIVRKTPTDEEIIAWAREILELPPRSTV